MGGAIGRTAGVSVGNETSRLTVESPELYQRSGVGYGLACVADYYSLTQVAAGWHAYYTHILDGKAWRRARQEDFALLPDEAKAAGKCLIFDVKPIGISDAPTVVASDHSSKSISSPSNPPTAPAPSPATCYPLANLATEAREIATPTNGQVGMCTCLESPHISPANVFCNPPYSQIRQFIGKAAEEARAGRATVVCLVPARTDTRWWHQWIYDARWHRTRPGVEVRFLKGRLKFGGSDNSAPFPSALVVFRRWEGR